MTTAKSFLFFRRPLLTLLLLALPASHAALAQTSPVPKSGNLDNLLWLESDRLATLTDVLDKAKLDNQRDVVKNERRQSYENQPYGKAFLLITENIFPKGHPYSWPVIGSHEVLTAASLDDVKNFFKSFYTPNNLSLVISGDFDPAEARRLVEKYFGGIPAGPAPERPTRWVPKLDGERVVEVKDRVPQERVYLNWATPPLYDREDGELDLAASILSDGRSSRLDKLLVFDRQLVSDVTAFQASREIVSVFTVFATARPGASLQQIEQLITDEQRPITGQELADARASRVRGYALDFETYGQIAQKVSDLLQFDLPPTELQRATEEMGRAQLSSVNAAAQKYAVPGQATLLVIGDRSKIEAGLRELNLGEIVILDTEGRPLTRAQN